MMRFCERMTCSQNHRKMYCHIICVMMLLFHATYPGMHGVNTGIVASTILVFFLMLSDFMSRLLDVIRQQPLFMMLIGGMAVACALAEEMYTLGVTLSFLLLATIFWPSRRMESFMTDRPAYGNYKELERETIRRYFV